MRLNLKMLAGLPVPEKPKSRGDVLRGRIEGDIVVIDGFKDRNYVGRYILQPCTLKYRTYVNGEWSERKLVSLFEKSYCWYDTYIKGKFEVAAEEEQILSELLRYKKKNGTYHSSVLELIDDAETRGSRDKKYHALERKEERFEQFEKDMPPVPYDAWLYWLKCMNAPDYMIYDKEKSSYRCSSCGKLHNIRNLKHNMTAACPETGENVTVKKRQQRISFTGRLQLIQSVNADLSVSRFFDMKLIYDVCGKHLVCDESVRILLERGKKKGKLRIHYSQAYTSSEPEVFGREFVYARSGKMWDTNPYNRKYGEAYLWPEGVQEALKGTVYENLRLQETAQKGYSLDYNRIMANYDKSGYIEYLVKLGLERLACEENSNLGLSTYRSNTLGSGGYYGRLNLKGTNASEILGTDMQRIYRLRNNNGGNIMLSWLQYESFSGSRVTDEALKFYEDNGIRADGIKGLLDKMSPVKAMNYLKKQHEQYPKESIKDLITTWADYMSMAKRLKMDTDDEVVYRTKDLVKRHDELVELIREMRDDMVVCEIAGKFPDAEDNLKEIRDRFTYSDGKYSIIVPGTIKEILDDGRQLHHCAASSERYFDRINRKETYLMFCRKAAEPDRAYYTLEVQPDGAVRQKRTFYNRQENVEEIQKFIKKWQKEIKGRLTDSDRLLGKRSTVQNEIDIITLLVEGNHKPSSVRVANELLNDLMAI